MGPEEPARFKSTAGAADAYPLITRRVRTRCAFSSNVPASPQILPPRSMDEKDACALLTPPNAKCPLWRKSNGRNGHDSGIDFELSTLRNGREPESCCQFLINSSWSDAAMGRTAKQSGHRPSPILRTPPRGEPACATALPGRASSALTSGPDRRQECALWAARCVRWSACDRCRRSSAAACARRRARSRPPGRTCA